MVNTFMINVVVVASFTVINLVVNYSQLSKVF